MPLLYPTTEQIDKEIAPQVTGKTVAGRLGLELMPIVTSNRGVVRWKQRDAYRGLQQLRGLDGSPSPVNPVGQKLFQYDPGVFGEFETLDETERTQMSGQFNGDVDLDVTQWTIEAVEQLDQREIDRIEYLNWQVMTLGQFEVTNAKGRTFKSSFSLTTRTISNLANFQTATPLADIRQITEAGFGLGTNFGAGARMIVNRVTANKILNNSNPNDLGGVKLANGASLFGLAQLNQVLLSADLPSLEIYDNGYLDDAGVATRFIPTDHIVLLGQRPNGDRLGEYYMTKCVPNNNMPGNYTIVKNDEDLVPPKFEVHRGHNGGPVLYYPGSVGSITF